MTLEAGTVAVVAGATLLALAVVWRSLARWRGRRLLRSALASPDPAVRRASVEIAAAQGMRRHARALLALANSERDPSVRAVLAAAVRRHQWEPADIRPLVELRLWALTEPTRPEASDAPPTGSPRPREG
jgi:hypothetical protein